MDFGIIVSRINSIALFKRLVGSNAPLCAYAAIAGDDYSTHVEPKVLENGLSAMVQKW